MRNISNFSRNKFVSRLWLLYFRKISNKTRSFITASSPRRWQGAPRASPVTVVAVQSSKSVCQSSKSITVFFACMLLIGCSGSWPAGSLITSFSHLQTLVDIVCVKGNERRPTPGPNWSSRSVFQVSVNHSKAKVWKESRTWVSVWVSNYFIINEVDKFSDKRIPNLI